MSYNSNVRYTEGRGGNQARNPMDIRGLLAPPTEQNPVYSSRNYERGNTAHKPEQPSYSQLCLEPGNALPVPPMPRDGSTSPQQPHSPRSMVSRSSGEYPQVSYHSSPYYHSSVSGGEYSYQQQHHGSRDTAPLSPGQGRTEASSVARSVRPKKALKGVAGAYPCACGRSYSRAEHLRRHQKNHAQNLRCNQPGCDRVFHRSDLLELHKEAHLWDQKRVGPAPE